MMFRDNQPDLQCAQVLPHLQQIVVLEFWELAAKAA